MNPTNGNGHNDNKNEMMSMEMESLHPGANPVRLSQEKSNPCANLWMLIKLHVESYPKIFSTIGLIGLAFFMYVAVQFSTPPVQRHRVEHDYSQIHLDYDFKATQIDHWCLFGGDNACRCEDFTEPVPREENKGWLAQHEANKEAIKLDYDYDVVFLGDDIVEELNGTWYHVQRPDGNQIKDEWQNTFTYDKGSNFDSLALGIAGDSSSNLLWRINHGEMPPKLFAKVWWISIGANDLARGGCSEEAAVLGILRVAEEVYYNNAGSVVVIQGILPRSNRRDGSLSANSVRKSPFAKKPNANTALSQYQLWPSIKAVNKELEDFCKEHGHIVYFDASNLFLGTMGNALYHSKTEQIVSELMPDYIHPSLEGHKVLNQAILREVQNIVLDEDETNDIEEAEAYVAGDGN